MLFTSFDREPCAWVNLDDEAARWQEQHPSPGARNPLIDPRVCGGMVEDVHRRAGVTWSLGGYLENRSRLWRDSYLQATGAFLHLGVDFNVPQGTNVVAGFTAGIVVVDDDQDQDGGWGERIILKPDVPGLDVLLIYAHLQAVQVSPGQRIAAGTPLAEVGGPPHNGNWHPHLHVQAMRRSFFEEILLNRMHELDGYGQPAQRSELAHTFPDPVPVVAPWLISV